MRYLVLGASSLIAMLLNTAVFSRINVFGIAPDVMLAVMACMVFAEKTLTPVWYVVGGAVAMDMLFSPAIGYYSVPYIIAGMVLYALSSKQPTEMAKAAIVCAVYVGKSLIMAFIAFLMGGNFSFAGVLLRYTIGEALFTGAAAMLLTLFYSNIYGNHFMQPQKASDIN